MPIVACPFEPGQTVVVTDGHRGRALQVRTVKGVGITRGDATDPYVILDDNRAFFPDSFGYSRRHGRTARVYVEPATPEKLEEIRREGLLVLLERSRPRWKSLPTPAIEALLETLRSYLPVA